MPSYTPNPAEPNVKQACLGSVMCRDQLSYKIVQEQTLDLRPNWQTSSPVTEWFADCVPAGHSERGPGATNQGARQSILQSLKLPFEFPEGKERENYGLEPSSSMSITIRNVLRLKLKGTGCGMGRWC